MSGLYTHGVHDGIDCHTRQSFLLLKRYAQPVECVKQLRIYFIETLRSIFLYRLGIIAYVLKVYFRNLEVCPVGSFESLPVAEGFEAEFKEPLGFSFLGRDKPYHIFIKTFWYDVGVYVGGKAVFVFPRSGSVQQIVIGLSCIDRSSFGSGCVIVHFHCHCLGHPIRRVRDR